MTLNDLDALIAQTPNAAVIYLSQEDWHELCSRPAPLRDVKGDGRIVYRGLDVWIRLPGETEVIDRARAAFDGILDYEH